MLLVEDDDELSELPDKDETALATKLGAAGLATIDANLLKQATDKFGKAARIVYEAIEEGGFPIHDEIHVRLHLRRLIGLAESGALEWAGNMRWPRFSEVRLPADAWELVREQFHERKRAKEHAAFEDAVRQTEQHPDDPKGWRKLAYAYARDDNYAAAIAACTRRMELTPRKPAVFFDRGGYARRAADYEGAIADFSQGLVLCDELNDDDYREVLHFVRAEAFFQLGRKAEARADLAYVADDWVDWTIEVPSKAELLALCTE